jgi:hypothetical protein
VSRRRQFNRRLIAATWLALIVMPCAAQEPAKTGSLLLVPTDIYNAATAEPAATVDASTAEKVFEAARQAVTTGAASDAFRLALATLELDPDHAGARALLGYTRVKEEWVGAYGAKMLAAGQEWSDQYGWIKEGDFARYAAGERRGQRGWVSLAEDIAQHDRIDNGWTVRTDHVQVTTNVSRQAGVELAVRLEALYQMWRQLFGEFAITQKELAGRLAGRATAGARPKPFRVFYHRDRQQYNDALRRWQPQIESTLGIYFDSRRESHFFAGAEQDPGTLAHEAVHQFFYESFRGPTRHLAATANLWAVEGVACYFESLTQVGARTWSIGAADAGRLQAARHRRVFSNFYVPLAELTALGTADMQSRPDLPQLYSQSAGLASFFMDGDGGELRPAFRKLLVEIYDGRDDAGSLAAATGVEYGELDRRYDEYMQSLPVTAAIAP